MNPWVLLGAVMLGASGTWIITDTGKRLTTAALVIGGGYYLLRRRA